MVAVRFGNSKTLGRCEAIRVQLARVERRVLAWTESLDVLADIGDRGRELPAQTVIQSDVRLDLPAVLSIEIQCSAPNIFDLRRALPVRTGQSHEIVRVKVG